VGGPLYSMFQRIDKEGKGYINHNNLDELMKNDKSFFAGKGPTYILEKYGTDGKMTLEQFVVWWNSTYTSYNDTDDTVEHVVPDTKMQQSN
jgi:Ca2+-binding EF-hand superfamily protein